MRWLITTGRIPYLILLAVLTAFFAYYAFQVRIDQSNESMNAQTHAQEVIYRDFRETFGSDEILLLAVTRTELLTPAGLQLIHKLTKGIAGLDGVVRVISLTNAHQLVHTDIGADPVPLVPSGLSGDELEQEIEAALDRNPELADFLVSADRETTGIAIQIANRPDDGSYRRKIVDGIRGLTDRHAEAADFHLTGLTVQKLAVARLIQRDQRVLLPLVAVILAGVLAFFFGRPAGVLLLLLVTAVSLTWTIGIYALLGYELNTVTSLLAPTVMVLSIAAGVHLYHGWLTCRLEEADSQAVILRVVGELAGPCFFTALTTAIGLVSLTVSQTPAVRQFGIFAAVGVFLSFAIAITLIPVGLSYLPPPSNGLPRTGLVQRFLLFSANLSTKRRGLVIAMATLITIVAVAGIPRIRNNTNLVLFLRESEPLRRATMLVDHKLTGSNSLEFIIQRRDGKALTSLQDIRRLAAFEEFAGAQAPITDTITLADIIRHLHRAEHNTGKLELPKTESQLLTCFNLLEYADEELRRMIVTSDFTRTRASFRIKAIGTAEAEPLVDRLLQRGRKLLGPDYELTPTGNFYFVITESNGIVRSQVRSFALAVTLAIVAIGILFRSIRLMLLAIIPNILPIIWTAGLMGYSGIHLSTGTAMIASVAIGLAVDDTIYYLARFRREASGNPVTAVRRTTSSTGRALTIASLSLVLGFWAGCFGSFKPTIYFSLLTGFTMATALLCDLWVLPACLTLTNRKKEMEQT